MAWMPTLSADTQAVLATDKVRFQGQEVAFVIADDRYSARDALELIDVEYEPLPVVVDARRALDADAPVIRDDDRPRRQPHLRLGGRRRGGDRGGVRAAPTSWSSRRWSSRARTRRRWRPAARWRDFDRVERQADASGARRRRRTRTARCTRSITGLPEHKIRVISPDVGGGFGNKVPVYPGYVCAIGGAMLARPAGQVGRGPLGEPDVDRVRARLRDDGAGSPPTREGRILAVAVDVIADHGAFNATAQPSRYPAGFFSVFTGSYDVAAAHCRVTGVYTNKAPGGVAYACSFRIAEAVYLVERTVDCLARELGMDPGRRCGWRNLLRARAVPVREQDGLGLRLRRLRAGAAQGARDRRLRRAAPRAGGASASAAS